MINPWNIDDAFSPMFCDVVSISWRRDGVDFKTSATVCAFPEEKVDLMTDASEDTTVRQISILIPKDDAIVATRGYVPQAGDKITTLPHDNWKIFEAQECHNWYQVTARSIDKASK